LLQSELLSFGIFIGWAGLTAGGRHGTFGTAMGLKTLVALGLPVDAGMGLG